MNRRTIGTLLAVLALCVAPSAAAAPDAQGEREIAYLIDYVAASACRFVRNGTEHPGPDASKHLATKYGRVRGRVDSDVVLRTRSERAATTWSASIAIDAATAVRTTEVPQRGTSGATTAAAISACCSGSL